ncbi:TraB/GumN family protein [Candidatus Woesearchaeota archaeon]|nr:TraB/GumN family protein [Candidatus Woesearchaeota archaeon]
MATLPFVWELQYKGVTSLAIGTCHVYPYDITEPALQYVRGRRRLFLECIDAGRREFVKGTENFTHKLAPQDVSKLTAFIGYPPENLRDMDTPTILGAMQAKAMEALYGRVLSVDVSLFSAAQSSTVQCEALENREEKRSQLLDLRDLEGDLALWVQKEDADFSKLKESLKSMVDAYDSGDPAAVRSVRNMIGLTLDQMLQKYPSMHEPRNRRMVERSLPFLDEPCVVAVGTAHFICEPSMLALYEEHGVRVRRMA